MDILMMAVAALALMTMAGYAQLQIPHFTRGSGRRVLFTRALLIAVGVGFGLLGAADFTAMVPKWLAFLVGFGLVHLPAAVILFIKSRRGTGKS